jgi:hypothetical protein
MFFKMFLFKNLLKYYFYILNLFLILLKIKEIICRICFYIFIKVFLYLGTILRLPHEVFCLKKKITGKRRERERDMVFNSFGVRGLSTEFQDSTKSLEKPDR